MKRLLLCILFILSAPSVLSKTPNILWIVGENFSLDLACYGQKNVRTPNLDRLAREGTRYTKVYSTSPVCAPSRSALMTGWYATTTDMHHMRSHRTDGWRLPVGVRPITHLLKDAGYHTANITHIGKRIVGTGKLDLNFAAEGPVYAGKNWADLKKKQPFFAQINMPEAEYDIYDRKSAEKPRVKWVGEEWHPKIATPENVTPPPYYPDHKITREEWARYLNSVSGTDVRIGWILDQLRKDGLSENHRHLLRRQRPTRCPRHPLVLGQRPARADDYPLPQSRQSPAPDQSQPRGPPSAQPARPHRHHPLDGRHRQALRHAKPRLPWPPR
jgi:N-sulfoglucosamine sulfohydrolase